MLLDFVADPSMYFRYMFRFHLFLGPPRGFRESPPEKKSKPGPPRDACVLPRSRFGRSADDHGRDGRERGRGRGHPGGSKHDRGAADRRDNRDLNRPDRGGFDRPGRGRRGFDRPGREGFDERDHKDFDRPGRDFGRPEYRSPYGDLERPPHRELERPPYEELERPPYGEFERPPYGEIERPPYGEFDRPPYGEFERPRYGEIDRLPRREFDRPGGDELDRFAPREDLRARERLDYHHGRDSNDPGRDRALRGHNDPDNIGRGPNKPESVE